MSNITELRKYAETKEFKDIVSKCKNRQDTKADQVLALYVDWVCSERSESIYNNHDVNAQRLIFTKARLDEIYSNCDWAMILKEDMQEEIDRAEIFITLWIRDQYGITNSSQIFDKIDLIRCDMQDNRYFQTKIDWMIAALEKDSEEKPSLTSHDPD